MDFGQDNYTTVAQIQAYLGRDLSADETASLKFIIPAVSRWIDRTLGSCFDKLDKTKPYGTAGSGWTQRHFSGGHRVIDLTPCQNILTVAALNTYDNTVFYTYQTPLEFLVMPYDTTVKTYLEMRRNEFTGPHTSWPGGEGNILVTALFTEYDYVNDRYPTDIVLLSNHVSAVWLQNNQSTDSVEKEQVEGHMVQYKVADLEHDPMVTRILQSRDDVWLGE